MHVLIELLQTVKRLRAPDGCPWDRKQTHSSLKPFMLEEAYEAADAVQEWENKNRGETQFKRGQPGVDAIREELGDVLLQVLLNSEMADESGAFDFAEVAKSLNDKLIRRHPHVFANDKAGSAEVALGFWNKQKEKEKAEKPAPDSILDEIPRSFPAFLKAQKTIEKVTRVGFQWPDLEGPLEKLREEVQELETAARAAVQAQQVQSNSGEKTEIVKNIAQKKVFEELGDLLFACCNVAHFFKISPEEALQNFLVKFKRRFQFVERGVKQSGTAWEKHVLNQLDEYWNQAKALEKIPVIAITGGIASGKSTATQYLHSKYGIPVFDADQIARDLRQNDEGVRQKIQTALGTLVDREIAALVFKHPEKKKILEEILHPEIRRKSEELIFNALKANPPYVIYEASQLLESLARDPDPAHRSKFHRIVTIEAPDETRVQRLVKRNSLTADEARRRIQCQFTREQRLELSDQEISADGTLDAFHKRLDQAHQEWSELLK